MGVAVKRAIHLKTQNGCRWLSDGGGEVHTDTQDLNTPFPDTPDTLEVKSHAPILKLPLGERLVVGRESVDQLGKPWCKTQEAQTPGSLA